MLVDSHCHLDLTQFDADRDAVLARARLAGVRLIVNPGIDLHHSRQAIALAERYPEVYAAVGIHPNNTNHFDRSALNQLRTLAAHPKVVAIGEIGLDYHYDFVPKHVQAKVFASQIELALELDRPVIIHTREAADDTIAMLKEAGQGRVRGVMHCFTGTADEARRALDLGFSISFSGILTFPRAGSLRDVAAAVPADRLLVETDAPYLAPVPHRGRRNEPAFVVETLTCLAELRGLYVEVMAAQVAANLAALVGPLDTRGTAS